MRFVPAGFAASLLTLFSSMPAVASVYADPTKPTLVQITTAPLTNCEAALPGLVNLVRRSLGESSGLLAITDVCGPAGKVGRAVALVSFESVSPLEDAGRIKAVLCSRSELPGLEIKYWVSADSFRLIDCEPPSNNKLERTRMDKVQRLLPTLATLAPVRWRPEGWQLTAQLGR